MVGMTFASPPTMIWPTGIGDFLVRTVSPSNAETDNRSVARKGSDGYLRTGPARPLLWVDTSPVATTTLVLRFEEKKIETPEFSTATLGEETPMGYFDEISGQPMTLVADRNERSMGATEAAEVVPEPSKVDDRILMNQRFVNWVTQRTDDAKVEIPFMLPSDPNLEEPAAPTERVRVRYRTEP